MIHRPAPLPAEFAESLARAGDRPGPFARSVHWFPTVSSTNDVAAAFAERGAPEGCVVVANAQSAGRGRHGRSWVSPAGAGLYLSAVLRPTRDALGALTIAAGVGVAEAVEAATGLEVSLKWPNDVYAGTRKLAGVLAEAGDGLAHVILGIGINVMPAAYPPEVAARATSLEEELGRPVDRGLLFVECLAALARRYEELTCGGAGAIVDAWRRRAARMLGRRVRWETAGAALEGVAENIDATGALVVRTSTGIVTVTAGEVLWL